MGVVGKTMSRRRAPSGPVGEPLLSDVLLVRVTLREPSASASSVTQREGVSLKVVAHCSSSSYATSSPPPSTLEATSRENSDFFESQRPLQGLLTALATPLLQAEVRMQRNRKTVAAAVAELSRRGPPLSLASSDSPSSPLSPVGLDIPGGFDVLKSRGQSSSSIIGGVAEELESESTITPFAPMVSPWAFGPSSRYGCYLLYPSAELIHAAHQSAVCCLRGSQGLKSIGEAEVPEAGDGRRYFHGYAYAMRGSVFGTSVISDSKAASVVAMEASCLVICLLSKAPIYSFARAVTEEAVVAMCRVAQQVYRTHSWLQTDGTIGVAPPYPRNATTLADYRARLDPHLVKEVLRPIAEELLSPSAVASRTVPGGSFSISLGPSTRETAVATSKPMAITLQRPFDLLYPLLEVPLNALLLSFNEDALRVLQSLLLQEERVVVIGATPLHASACALALPALLAPLVYAAPLVPFLSPSAAIQGDLLAALLFSPPTSASAAVGHGMIIGSTPAIVPHLMLLWSRIGAASSNHRSVDSSGNGRQGESDQLWVADARTGYVSCVPEEPIARLDLVPLSTAKGVRGDALIHEDVALKLAVAMPQQRRSSATASGGAPSNPVDLFGGVRAALKTIVQSNVLNAAPLPLLPPWPGTLRDHIRRANPPEDRLRCRMGLAIAAYRSFITVGDIEELMSRLQRVLRGGSSDVADDDDGDVDRDRDGAVTDEGDASSSGLAALLQDAMRTLHHTGDPPLPPPSFPVVSFEVLLQVHAGLLDYNTRQFFSAYRRGLNTPTVRSTAAMQQDGITITAAAYLTPGLDHNYLLSQTVARTHQLRRFHQRLIAAETFGVRRVLGGALLSQSQSVLLQRGTAVTLEDRSDTSDPRQLLPLALFYERARQAVPELFVDLAGFDGVGAAYQAILRDSHFAEAAVAPILPMALRVLAGAADHYTISSSAVSSSSGGGSMKKFFSKAAKAVMSGLQSGGNSGGPGGRQGVVYLPELITCPLVCSSYIMASSVDDISTVPAMVSRRHRHRHHRHLKKQLQHQLKGMTMEFSLSDVANPIQVLNSGSNSSNGSGEGDIRNTTCGRFSSTPASASIAPAQLQDYEYSTRDLSRMAEAALYICHSLPLDAVRQFDAYHPLLAPKYGGAAAAQGEQVVASASVATYMATGSLIPQNMNMWRHGEELAAAALLSPATAAPAEPQPSPRPTSAGSPPSQGSRISPAETQPATRGWTACDSSVNATSSPQHFRAGIDWGAFTSGVPEGYTAAAVATAPIAPAVRWDAWGTTGPAMKPSSELSSQWTSGSPSPFDGSPRMVDMTAVAPGPPASTPGGDVLEELFPSHPPQSSVGGPAVKTQSLLLDDFF